MFLDNQNARDLNKLIHEDYQPTTEELFRLVAQLTWRMEQIEARLDALQRRINHYPHDAPGFPARPR